MKYLRYIRESDRGNQAAMRQFHQLQMMRLKYGDRLATAAAEADEAPSGADSGPQTGAPTASGTPAEPAAETGHRNEADTTQVSGGTSSNEEAPRTTASPAPTDYNWTPEQIAEVVAFHRRKRESEQQRE
jgi:hypothetical protein